MQADLMCRYKGRMYKLGQRIYPDEDQCSECVCNPDEWNETDVLNSTSCRKISCDLDLEADAVNKMKRGCVPIYDESKCCPVDYHCRKYNKVFKLNLLIFTSI